MKSIQLSIARPADVNIASWPSLHDKLMQYLVKEHELDRDDASLCNARFEEFLPDGDIKNMAVLAFGNDWPSTVTAVKKLRLIGDGDCPACGSNDRRELTDGYIRGHGQGDRGGYHVYAYQCNTCQYVSYIESHK